MQIFCLLLKWYSYGKFGISFIIRYCILKASFGKNPLIFSLNMNEGINLWNNCDCKY